MRHTGSAPKEQGHIHYGYIVFIGACLLMLPEALPINTAGIFYGPVTAELGIPLAAFSMHTTIISLSIFLMMGRVMKLFERLDIRVFMSGVITIEAACFFLYASASSVLVFYVASFFIGMALAALVNIVVPVLVNNWFSARVNLLIGIGTCMQGIGGALFNAVGSTIIAAYGWRMCYVCFGMTTLAIGIPVAIFVLRKHPADKGLVPIGALPSHGSDAEMPTTRQCENASRKNLLPWMTVSCLLLAVGMIFNYHINSYIVSLGASIEFAGVASAMVMVGMCVGKVALGTLCDWNIHAGIAVGCGSGIVALAGLSLVRGVPTAAVCVLCLLFGITYAASSLLGTAATRYVFGAGQFDRFWPHISRFIALGNAAGSFIWGLAVQTSGYRSSMLLCCAVIALAGVGYGVCARLRSPCDPVTNLGTELRPRSDR